MSAAAKTTGANPGKDVIYIDVDDEITGIIDKVRGSGQKIVALVLPKRATVLQSIVNMKLLKRAAEEAQKNIVLITSEAGLLPLAGNVGMHVAKTLQTKPEIPEGPGAQDNQPLAVDETDADTDVDDEPLEDDVSVDKARTVGELAMGTTVEDDLDDTIEMDDEDEDQPDPEVSDGVGSAAVAAKKSKDKKKFSVPNFNRFRLLMLLGIPLVILLIIGGYVCLAVLPKASVVIQTDSQAINSSAVLTLKTNPDTKLDIPGGVVPATVQSTQKTLTQQVDATGQQNNGVRATGKVTLALGDCSVPSVTIPAGSALAASGLTFITQESATLSSVKIGSQCKNSSFPNFSTATVDVNAQTGGAQYNLAATNYTVPGFSNVSGSGTAMAGGTDNITKIVTKADIDNATQKIGAQDTTTLKTQLQTTLATKNLIAITETFNAAAPETKTSVNAGDAADNVTVTQTITYTMLGVTQSDLQKLVAADVDKKIDTKKQSILDYGLTSSVYGLQSQNPDGASVTFQTTVVAGSNLNVAEIKSQIVGKKAGDAKSIIKQNPGVKDVTVSYSPFWVSSIPGKTSKITITVQKPKITKATVTHGDASTNP